MSHHCGRMPRDQTVCYQAGCTDDYAPGAEDLDDSHEYHAARNPCPCPCHTVVAPGLVPCPDCP